jgi:hypothetical protein
MLQVTNSQAGDHFTPAAKSSLPSRTFNWELSSLQSRAVAYCRQSASTVTLGIEPRCDPWPYICSVSRLLLFYFRCSSFDKKGGVGLFYNWYSLTTPYSTRGHIKVGWTPCTRPSRLWHLGIDRTENTVLLRIRCRGNVFT